MCPKVTPTFQAGRSMIARDVGAGSTELHILRPRQNVDPRWLCYAVRSKRFLDEGVSAFQGVAGLQRVPTEFVNSFRVADYRVDEQQRIAEFLDDQVSRIDQIAAARQEQLAMLKLQETAEIQAIFDASARRFGLIRLGYLLRRLEQGWSPQAEAQPANENEWGVMRSGCVNGGHFQASDNKRLPPTLEPVTRYEIRGGDLLMSRASGSLDLIGSVAVVPGDVRKRLLLCDKVYRLTPDLGWSSEFLAPMLRSSGNRDRIRLGVSGADGMANNLPSGVIRDLRVPAAPHAAQMEVIEQAHRLAQRADLIRSDISRSIDLFAEYKTSLITAAVTGELDVATAGSNIPG